ncbi:MAG: hypothetical protein MUP67_13060 [Acidimicrobiia bacterium]|nr:hypothetical protein [Acidimicrobiia bacterium]
MDVAIALVVGLAAGTHTSIWGMYKDAPYEGFTYRTFSRSILLSAGIGVAIELVADFDMEQAASIAVLFGLTYVIERAMTEFYKTFLRDEDQSKYFIPMQLSIRGKVVEQRGQVLLAGAGYALVVAAIVLGIDALQSADILSGLAAVLVIGSAGGWISAFGGAWKDAPLEGFSIFKFFRSPLVSLSYAILLGFLTTSYVYVAMGALGYTVATLETYKTFFKPSTPRGKFSGKEIRFPDMLTWRKRFVPVYVAIWIAIVVTFVIALAEPNTGLIG